METDRDLQSGFRTRTEKLPTKKNKEISWFALQAYDAIYSKNLNFTT